MQYVILGDNILDSVDGRDWLLKHDPDTGQFWIVYLDQKKQPSGLDDPQDEWRFEEAQGVVSADVRARAVAARNRLA